MYGARTKPEIKNGILHQFNLDGAPQCVYRFNGEISWETAENLPKACYMAQQKAARKAEARFYPTIGVLPK